MKRTPNSHQRHDLYVKYQSRDSEIGALLGECGLKPIHASQRLFPDGSPFVDQGPVAKETRHNMQPVKLRGAADFVAPY
jgi:hypothetical protein